jgi:putative oxidoreductase
MNTIIAFGKKVYQLFVTAASSLQSPFLLLVRMYWGWQLFVSGKGKLGNLAGVTEFFTSLNLPFPAVTARFVSGLEFFGGILLFVGLFSRPLALVLTVNMLVAYYTADHEALLSFISDPDKFMAAAPFTFLLASLLVLIFGPGKFCLDTLVGWYFDKKS